MIEGLRLAIERVLASKKVVIAGVAAASNLVAVTVGVDPTEGAMAVTNGIFAILLGAQVLLDLRWGSPSDGTGPPPPEE